MGNIVQAWDGVEVPVTQLSEAGTPDLALPGVLAVVPEEGDGLCLSPVCDVRTVPAVYEDLVVGVGPTLHLFTHPANVGVVLSLQQFLPGAG